MSCPFFPYTTLFRSCELFFHPQCFLSEGHFAGGDSERLAALREVMADPSVDAVWFARGGYGSNRIAEAALADLPEAARTKQYLGYSDAGFLLAGMHKAGLEVAWGPMPQDVLRAGGDAAIARALDWLIRRDRSALEPQLQPPAIAFNLTVLPDLLGTALEPTRPGDAPHHLVAEGPQRGPAAPRTDCRRASQRGGILIGRGGDRRALVRSLQYRFRRPRRYRPRCPNPGGSVRL